VLRFAPAALESVLGAAAQAPTEQDQSPKSVRVVAVQALLPPRLSGNAGLVGVVAGSRSDRWAASPVEY